MVDAVLIPAIKAALQANELGTASPYCLSFAELGQSGASFGVFQGDTNESATARGVLSQALTDYGTAAADIARIMAAVSKPCTATALSAADTATANAALSSETGKALVDGMDAELLQIVLNELDSSNAAVPAGFSIAPAGQLYISLWVNMTGAPKTLNLWLGGTPELALPPPAGPVVSRQDLETYLRANKFFLLHPRNFVHMSDSVDAGLAVL